MDMFGAMPESSAPAQQQQGWGYGDPYGGMVDLNSLSYGNQQQQPQQQQGYGYGYGYDNQAYGYGNQAFGGYGY